MCDSQELTERFRKMLQRNAAVPRHDAEIVCGERYQDVYGHRVTVTGVSPTKITYRRDGYGLPSELGRDKFIQKFKEVSS